MNWARSIGRQRFFGYATCACVALLVACSPKEQPAAADDRAGFATRYAAAWSGKDPVSFGAFYEENGSLIVNGSASVGRAAIVETARSYMAAFPDMVVRLDSLQEEPGVTVFHWTWTGTNTGPGGTGKAVNLRGYERWSFGPNGLLLTSDGHFDDAEYQRQLKGESEVARWASTPAAVDWASPHNDACLGCSRSNRYANAADIDVCHVTRYISA